MATNRPLLASLCQNGVNVFNVFAFDLAVSAVRPFDVAVFNIDDVRPFAVAAVIHVVVGVAVQDGADRLCAAVLLVALVAA